ncbi:MAG: hypothetical protein U0326_22665 [Polyangiales bacterium]
MSNDPSNPNASPPADPTAAPPAAPPAAQPPMPSFAQPMPAIQPPFAQPAMPSFAQPMAPQYPQPMAPQYPHAPMPSPFAQPAMQPPFAQPAMPSFAQPMPVAQPAMPVAQPVMAPPVAAPPVVAANGPVIGLKDQYRFAEEAVAQKAQVSILESPKVPPELPSPSRIDPNFEQLKIALEAQLARNAIAPMMYAPPNATRWFRFSPYELFLEQVLARKLWTLE